MVENNETRFQKPSFIVIMLSLNLGTVCTGLHLGRVKNADDSDFLQTHKYQTNTLPDNHVPLGKIDQEAFNRKVIKSIEELLLTPETRDLRNRRHFGVEESGRGGFEDIYIKRRLKKLLRDVVVTPRSEMSFQPKPNKESTLVRPMVRYPMRYTKSEKVDIDTLIDAILRHLKTTERKSKTNIEEKKTNQWRAGWQVTTSSSTESYERRRMRDFLTILLQLQDMGISVKQMNQLAQEPTKYKSFGRSLDEREAAATIAKLIESCEQAPLDVREDIGEGDVFGMKQILSDIDSVKKDNWPAISVS